MAESVNLVEQSVNFGRAFRRSNPQPQRGQSQWTDELVVTIKRLWKEGHSATGIAATIGGFSRNAVMGKIHRLGLNRTREFPCNKARPPKKIRRPRLPKPAPPVKAEAVRLPPNLEAIRRLEPVKNADGQYVTVLRLESWQCRFPIGDPKKPGMFFCARPCGEHVYCADHRRLCYQPGAPKKRGRGA